MTLTPAQLASLAALVGTGCHKAAAHRLGVSPSAQRDRCARARGRLGVETTTQAVYVTAASGELVAKVPVRERPAPRPNAGYHGPRSAPRR